MIQCCINYPIFLHITLFLFALQSKSAQMLQLDPNFAEPYCKKSKTLKDDNFEISCGLNSTILAKIYGYNDNRISELQYNCCNGNPLNISAVLNKTFVDVSLVKINSCRFAANESLATFLTDTLWNSKIGSIEFCNDQDDHNTLARTKDIIGGIDNFVDRLSFTILNASILPLDLFADVKNLKALSITTKSSNSAHLSGLLAPLTNLSEITLQTDNLQDIPGSIFANNKILRQLELSGSNISLLPSNFLSNLSSLETIFLGRSSFPCNDSAAKQNYLIDCSPHFEIIVKLNVHNHDLIPEINFVCYYAPLKTSALQSRTLEKYITVVRLYYCRFSTKENILKFLNDYVGSDRIEKIEFYIDRIDNSLSHANLRGIDKIVQSLSFVITNVSTLPTDLFADVKKLKILSISSDSIDSSHLTSVLAPLEHLQDMHLQTDNLQDISGSFFANKTMLQKLELIGTNVTLLPSNFFANRVNLETIQLSNLESMLTVKINDEFISEITFVCNDAEPLKISALQSKTLEKNITVMRLYYCRFSAKENILKFLNYYVGSDKIEKIEFYIDQIDNSLSHANLRGIDKIVQSLLFVITNVLTLPTDLFADLKNLKTLSISSYSINSSHLSAVLAPLEHLQAMLLKTDNLQDISGSFFANKTMLRKLELIGTNVTLLPSNFFANQNSLETIQLSNLESMLTLKINNELISEINFVCDDGEPLKINALQSKTLEKNITVMRLYYCRFSANESILKFLNYYVKSYKIERIQFYIDRIDNSLSHANLRGIDKLVQGLSFVITNVSTLPTDLFADFKKLKSLSIHSNSINSSHLSEVLAPLEDLEDMFLHADNLPDISRTIFANNAILRKLTLSGTNLTLLPSNFFANLNKLKIIHLRNPKLILTVKISDELISEITFVCNDAEPLKISALQSKTLEKNITVMRLYYCRFSAKESILKFLNYYVKSYKINTIQFYIDRIDNSLSHANLRGIDKLVQGLSFVIKNVSTLPTDLFADFKKLKSLSIYSNSINSSHLSAVLAPLEHLQDMLLQTDNLQDISGSIFANNTMLQKLTLSGKNVTLLQSNFFANLKSLKIIKMRNLDSTLTLVINPEFVSLIDFDCYNAEPLKIGAARGITFKKDVTLVAFNYCRFSAEANISKFLNDYVGSYKILSIGFFIDGINNSLSHENLRGIDKLVQGLSFTLTNVSTLPTDLFYDIGNLKQLFIYSHSMNVSYLSSLIAPLKDLAELLLEAENLQEISGSIVHQNLRELYINLKNITALPKDLFSRLKHLEYVFLCANSFNSLAFGIDSFFKICVSNENTVGSLKVLPDGLFRNLLHLLRIEINSYQLESIPFDTFINSTNINTISITGTNIHELPVNLLVDQRVLIVLDLSKNMISTISEGFFDCNKELEALNLSNNQLTTIAGDLFKPLTKLNRLELNNNNLLTISSTFNQPQLGLGSVFDNLKNLQILKLKNNSISKIPYNLMVKAKSLNILDLGSNKIDSIDCNFVTYFESKIIISDNPINCDCKILCLHQHMNENSIQENIELGTIQCESPPILKGKLLFGLKLSDLLCFSETQQGSASNKCTYNIRIPDSVLVMNCSSGNFTDIPMLPLPDQTFSNGIELFMDTNPLTKLSSKMLGEIAMLSIYGSPITKLPERFLSKLPKLKNVSLILQLEEIPVNTFDGSNAIQKLKLSGTNLEEFPEDLFLTQINLVSLDLSWNKLKRLLKYSFMAKTKLQTLRLSHNVLTALDKNTFYELRNLKNLFLDNNRLQHIDPEVFSYARRLEYITMENNQLTTIEPFFILLLNLQSLILTNNSIGNNHFIEIHQLEPSFLDMSLNNVCSIEYSQLDSIIFNKTFLNFTNTNIRTITNGNNSLKCDCRIITLVIENTYKIMYESLRCLSPDNIRPRNILLEELLCPMKRICPDGCLCWIRPVNSTLIVNCSNASLTELPTLPELETIFQNGIELSIDHNNLTSLRPHSSSGYKGVTKMFAAYNQITSIFSGDICEKIVHLDVSHNKIERLDDQIIKVINESRTLSSIHLYDNPIVCDCSSKNLIELIMNNKAHFPGIDQCEDGRKFKTLFYKEICSIESINVEKVISIALIIIFFALFLMTALYLNKKEQILIWMYANNICSCLVTEEEVDKDKKFDAFMSYSSWDAEFVEKLVSKLEDGPNPYKLCLHDRDWLAGGYIPDQIEKSVEVSKRTLIVMTEKYLTSKWTRFEFRTAHNASMNEKRIRVIVILVGDIDIEGLDSDLKKYVKMYTYLRWDDPWFWQKLGYALPHPSKKKQPNIKDNNLEMGYCYNANNLI